MQRETERSLSLLVLCLLMAADAGYLSAAIFLDKKTRSIMERADQTDDRIYTTSDDSTGDNTTLPIPPVLSHRHMLKATHELADLP